MYYITMLQVMRLTLVSLGKIRVLTAVHSFLQALEDNLFLFLFQY